MGVDIKAIKKELLMLAGKSEPPESFVRQNGIMDMMLADYFNPASRVSKELTLSAIAAGASVSFSSGGEPAEVSEAQVKAVLDKYKP